MLIEESGSFEWIASIHLLRFRVRVNRYFCSKMKFLTLILPNTDPSLVVGKRKEIVNVMRKARDNPNDYWDKKLLEVEERGLFIFFSKLIFF